MFFVDSYIKIGDLILVKLRKNLQSISFSNIFRLPMFLLGLGQGPGKSLLAKLLTDNSKISHSFGNDGATATMKPFLFIFRNTDHLGGEEYATFHGEKVPIEEIAGHIKKVNEDRKGEYSSVELRIEIYGKGLPNIDIVQFPNFRENEGNDERYDRVFSMFDTFIAKAKENENKTITICSIS